MTAYSLWNPTGNRTVLCELPSLPEKPEALARRLLKREPLAEQVGFLLPGDGRADIRLEMAGGEFCGNASMCAAVAFAQQKGVPTGEVCRVKVRCSGADGVLQTTAERNPDGSWRGTVRMPGAINLFERALPLDGGTVTLPVVRMEGITHIFSECDLTKRERPFDAEAVIEDWCGLLGAECLGIHFYDAAANRLLPLVYVRGVRSLYYESSCASGTAALGFWLSQKSGKRVTRSVSEPGGVLTVTADPADGVLLTGSVRREGNGTVPSEDGASE